MFVDNVSYSAAILAGILSFLSPCILPLIPAYFTFITGMSIEELIEGDDGSARRKLFFSTLSYVLGFSVVFIIMGAAISVMGHQMSEYRDMIRTFGGFVVVIFGVHLAGIIRIPWFDFEKRVHIRKKPLHMLGAFLVGMAFGAGWSPCIGPLLGTILAIAAHEGSVTNGIVLLSFYSLGLALPFIMLSIFINYMLAFIKKANKAIRYITVMSGVFLIIIGLALLFDKINVITGF
ncbi:MAG: cytochrome c biogenesis protein CcdA [Proteobacteria bacterium]|nr:cytochrome c biogenesis protein CcdA [Pseudomonadota bacterium]